MVDNDSSGERQVNNTDEKCNECGGHVIKERNEYVCEDCGLVIDDEMIDHGKEWRAFNHQENQKKSRTGSPETAAIHDKNLVTEIDWKDKDAYGNMISSEKRKQMGRMRKWQKRIRVNDSDERNLQYALSEVDRMGSALGVPRDIRTTASVIYRRALEEDLIRGRSIEGVATAALYAACRQEGIPRSLKEIASVSRVDKKEIGRTFSYIKRELNLHVDLVQPEQLIPRYCTKLDLSRDVERRSKEIAKKAAQKGLLSGKDPSGFAAAAVYTASLLCDERRTQKKVAEAAKVTEVTIRNRYQEQVEALGVYNS